MAALLRVTVSTSLPRMPTAPESLTLVTAADERFARCLWQFLRHVQRRGLHRRFGVLAFDLGLTAATRRDLGRSFPWCHFETFDFTRHPPHVARLEWFGWKPLALRTAWELTDGDLLWLDSATLVRDDLAAFRAALAEHGVVTLRNQATVRECTDPRTLAVCGATPASADAAMVAAGFVGFARSAPVARHILAAWCRAALDPAALAPAEPRLARHRFDQSLLSLIVQDAAWRGECVPFAADIDVSSPDPIRWISSRNKLSRHVPRWADPLARLWSLTWKAADRAVLRARRFARTTLPGWHRFPKEEFRVLTRAADATFAPLRAPPGSYLADPFVVSHGGRDWLFAEQFRYAHHEGRLVVLPLSSRAGTPDPVPLELIGPVCAHRSFPFVFAHGGQPYLLPETSANRCVDLYTAVDFPRRWRWHRRLLDGWDAVDSTLHWSGDRWWLLTFARRDPVQPRAFAIFSAPSLDAAAWAPHPVNAERRHAGAPFGSGRGAGPLLQDSSGAWLRPVQTSRRYYGEGVRFFRIDRLTPTAFSESPLPAEHPLAALAASQPWHHLAIGPAVMAGDVRTRVSYRQHLPWWPGALRPDPRARRVFPRVN